MSNYETVYDPGTSTFLRRARGPISSSLNSRVQSSSSKRKSPTVVPKQPKNTVKAAKKTPKRASPHTRHLRATERRSKCMEGSNRMPEYFCRLEDLAGGYEEPVLLTSDDGLPTASQRDRAHRKAEARKFLDCSASCSDKDSEECPSPTQEVDETMGGFIVSDGHLSSDEDSDPWGSVYGARRVGKSPSLSPRRGVEEEKEQEEASDCEVTMEDWTPCAQPPSPPMSPMQIGADLLESLEKEDDDDPEIPEPGVEIDLTEETNFRLSAQYLLLTYKSHLPKQQYITWLKAQVNRPDAWIRVAHENGDTKCPYRHTHVVVDFVTRVNVRNCHKFCYKNPLIPDKVDKCGAIHPNIKRLNGVQAFKDAKIYIGKEDPENKDLKAAKTAEQDKGARLVERIQASSSVNVALRTNLRKLSDAAGIVQIFNMRPLGIVEDLYIPPRPDRPCWVELLDQVEHHKCPPRDRKIIWFVDDGNSGKSNLASYLSRTYTGDTGYDWMCMTAIDDEREAYAQVVVARSQGFNCKGFIIDVARAHKYKKKVYAYLESFKNGSFTSTKYQGGNVTFNTPWVIVMSNFWPKVKELTRDRWDIRRINLETYVAEHLPPEAENPEEFKHCESCTCGQANHGRSRYQILQEQ